MAAKSKSRHGGTTIVKVQRALCDNTILVYDDPTPKWVREIYAQIELEPSQIRAILGDDLKGYFEAEIDGDDIVIGNRVADQEW